MWISQKMLYSPVWRHLPILSFLTLPELAISMTSRINRTLCVACYIRYVCLLTLGACALGKVVNPGHRRRLPHSVHWRAFDDRGMIVAFFQF